MANVEFHDFSVQVTEALDDAVIKFLYEAATTIDSVTKENSSPERYGDIQANALWSYRVNEDEKEARVGSDQEAGYWEEFGTGEHALYKNGRKGWWVYIEGQSSQGGGKTYGSKQEAEEVAAFLRSKGLKAHATNGREPNRPLFRAFNGKKGALERRAAQILKEGLK